MIHYHTEPVCLREETYPTRSLGLGWLMRQVEGRGPMLLTTWPDCVSGQWHGWPLVKVGPDGREDVPVDVQRALAGYARVWHDNAHEPMLFRRWADLTPEERLELASRSLACAITVHDGLTPEEIREDEAQDRETMGCTLYEDLVHTALGWMRLDHLPDLPTTARDAWDFIQQHYPLYSQRAVNPWLYAAVYRASWGPASPRAYIDPARLMPDGVTVLIADDDMGFTIPLDLWQEAGGGDLVPDDDIPHNPRSDS